MERNKEYILKLAYERNVKFIRFWFTDILGILKSFAITIDELEDALNEGVRFDGTTLNGFIRTAEHELIAMPDPATFQILPWRPSEDAVARMFCDIVTPDGKPYELDSRHILKKTLKKAADMGLTFYTGPEIEFFFFKNAQSAEPIDRGGYFDLTPLDTATDLRRYLVLTLEQMGVDIISSHHEGAHSQHEIDLRHEDALTTADNIMTFRLVAKKSPRKTGSMPRLCPKPMSNQNGSGMHMHMSLYRDESNIFHDADSELSLSADARHFIAGLLRHAPEFFAVTNQWINSYKRFLHGFEAPTYLSWSQGVHSSLIRVPEPRAGKPDSIRVELRNPDPSCNPYIAFAAILAAGLSGLQHKYPLEPPSCDNHADKSRAELQSIGLTPVPMGLPDALQTFQQSALMRETLGDDFMKCFTENKLYEINAFYNYVTDFEINRYLPIL